MTHSAWGTWQNSSLFIIDSFIIINQLSRHRDLAGCDRHRVSGSMPYTACHAASCRRTITPHLRLPYSVRPIRLILSYFLLRVSESPPLSCSSCPSLEFCKDGTLVFVPLRFAPSVSPSAAAFDERTGDNRGRYQSVPTFIHTRTPSFYTPYLSVHFTYQKNPISGVAEHFLRMQSAPPNQG